MAAAVAWVHACMHVRSCAHEGLHVCGGDKPATVLCRGAAWRACLAGTAHEPLLPLEHLKGSSFEGLR